MTAGQLSITYCNYYRVCGTAGLIDDELARQQAGRLARQPSSREEVTRSKKLSSAPTINSSIIPGTVVV